MRTRRLSIAVVLAVLLASCSSLSSGGASAPIGLSKQGTAAFNNTRVIKGLDLLRDTATAANAQTPPLLSTDTTRKIVLYHQAAIKTIDAVSSGWQATVLAGLDDVIKTLAPKEQQLLAPYIALVKTIIAEVA